MKHCMVDLETFSTNNDAVIISIGAIVFDPTKPTDEDDASFHVCVTPMWQDRYKRHMNAETVMWWMDPERAGAWKEWVDTLKFDLPTALEGFQMFLAQNEATQDILRVWGNGASFDNVILRSAYAATGQECPWNYYNDRCFRTLKNLTKDAKSLEPERAGTHHNALDDARHQVAWLRMIARMRGLTLS